MNSHKESGKSGVLPIALDVMGGDLGLGVAVEGAVQAVSELGIVVSLVGVQSEINEKLVQLGFLNHPLIQVVHASEVISMDDSPFMAIRGKSDSSIRVAFNLVKDGKAAAVVSAGNSGAIMAAGLFVLGALPGIARPAIATLIPKTGAAKPTVVLDVGANVDCHAYQLIQFAIMGHYYAKSVLGCDRPRVALLSNGTEECKGNDILRAAAHILSDTEVINFIGYIEGRDIPRDVADVVVCDGFLGNVVLKTMEGVVELVFGSLKCHVQSSWRGKLGMWLLKPSLKSLFHDKFDPSAYGGAPLLGMNGIGVVCHGRSGKRDWYNATRVAYKFACDGVVDRMQEALSTLDLRGPGAYQGNWWDRLNQGFDKKSRKQARNNLVDPATPEGSSEG